MRPGTPWTLEGHSHYEERRDSGISKDAGHLQAAEEA